jgi:hypothetical protein
VNKKVIDKKAKNLILNIQKNPHKSITTTNARDFCGEELFVEIIKHLKYEGWIENSNQGYQLTSKGYKFHPTKEKLKKYWKYIVVVVAFIIGLVAFLNSGIDLFNKTEKIINKKENQVSTVIDNKDNSNLSDKNSTNQLDTILEYNNPKTLDLTKHQLFIDTTRNSDFFKNLVKINQSQSTVKFLKMSMKEIGVDNQISINIKDFPYTFIAVRKLNNEFVLYDRCNGNDPVFQLTDSSFAVYGPLESEMEPIKKLIGFNGNRLKLQLQTYIQKSTNKSAIVTIDKTEYDNIFRITYESEKSNWVQIATPIEHAKDFNLIVNHCPQQMVIEYSKFDIEE